MAKPKRRVKTAEDMAIRIAMKKEQRKMFKREALRRFAQRATVQERSK